MALFNCSGGLNTIIPSIGKYFSPSSFVETSYEPEVEVENLSMGMIFNVKDKSFADLYVIGLSGIQTYYFLFNSDGTFTSGYYSRPSGTTPTYRTIDLTGVDYFAADVSANSTWNSQDSHRPKAIFHV